MSGTREDLESAIREELARSWRRCTGYIARGSTPAADPQAEGAVRRIMRAAERHASVRVIGAARGADEAAEGARRLALAAAEYYGEAPS